MPFSIRALYLQIKQQPALLNLKSDEQLSKELVDLIANGDILVFREENRYDQLAAARRWQDVPPAASSQLSVPKSAKSSSVNNSNNAGPGVSQPTAQGGKVATAATTPVLEPLDLYCALPNGKPAAGLPYKATLATGQVLQGKLDAKGFAHFTDLEPSKVDVEFGEQPDEDAIKATRSQIASALDSMLAAERAEGVAFESTYAELNLAEKGLVSTGALFTGIWREVTDLAEFANNVYELGAPQEQLKRAVNAAWSAYDTDSDNWAATFADNWQDSQHQAFVKVLGFDPAAISKKDIAEAYEIASFIYDDAETKALLMEFGKDYVSAQHHTELTDMAGTAVFEIILGALLAVATGGAGTAAMAASKLSKLKKLGGLFKKLGSELKKKAKFKKSSGSTKSKVEATLEKPKGASISRNSINAEERKHNTEKENEASLIDESQKTVFSGHGSYSTNNGDFIVPDGTEVTVYAEHGGMITDDLGHVIENGGNLEKVYKKTYGAGDAMPNYTLHPPDSLIEIEGTPVTVESPTTIDELIIENQGECHWAACLAQDGTAASHKAFDIDGVIDYDKKEWIKIYD